MQCRLNIYTTTGVPKLDFQGKKPQDMIKDYDLAPAQFCRQIDKLEISQGLQEMTLHLLTMKHHENFNDPLKQPF